MTTDIQIDELLQDPEVADRYVRYMKFSLLLHLYVGAEKKRTQLLYMAGIRAAHAAGGKGTDDEKRASLKFFADLTIQAHEATQHSREIFRQLSRMEREVAP